MKTYKTYMGERPVIPLPSGAEWDSPAWHEWWETLDHFSFCSHIALGSDRPAWETCRSIHCYLCGQSTGPQGHLDNDGNCPNV